MAEEWVEVYRTSEHLDAEFVKGLLTTSGIPVVIEAKGFKAMPYIFGTSGSGELVLKVPPDQADLALEILEAKVEESDPDQV